MMKKKMDKKMILAMYFLEIINMMNGMQKR